MWNKFKKVVKTILFVFYFILIMLLFFVYTISHPMLKRRYRRTRNPNHYPNTMLWNTFNIISKLFGGFVS